MKHDHVRLDDQLGSILARRAELGRLRRLTSISNKIDFSSNSYLSLASDAQVRRRYLESLISSEADLTLGSGGSRLLDGGSPLVDSLEKQIAAYHRAPTGLLFNSGYDANTGLLSCVPQANDVVVYDELVHASVHEGLRLSRAKRRIPFTHNVVSAPTGCVTSDSFAGIGSVTNQPPQRGLAQVLQDLVRGKDGESVQAGRVNIFIIVESLYSMDGDVAPLREFVQTIQEHLPKGNGYLIVDEAHSTGIFDERGQGLVCELGIERDVWARVHTFGKAVGCSGAIVLCSEQARQYLINYARSFIFTTAMAFSQLVSIRTCYDFLATGQARRPMLRLHALSQHCRSQLMALKAEFQPSSKTFDLQPGHQKSPIIALLTSKPHDLAKHCQEAGYLLRPVVFPTVPKGFERVRICLHAKNTFEEVNGLCQVIRQWLLLQMRSSAVLHFSSQEEDTSSTSSKWVFVPGAKL